MITGSQPADSVQTTFTDRPTFLGSASSAVNHGGETASSSSEADAPLASFAGGPVTTSTPLWTPTGAVQNLNAVFGQTIGGMAPDVGVDHLISALLTSANRQFGPGVHDLDVTPAPAHTYVMSETERTVDTAPFFESTNANPIASNTPRSGDTPQDPPRSGPNLVDNVVPVANAAVPEPGSLALFGSGLVGLLLRGLRRQTRAA
jgi:hypothetical protein